MSDIIEELTRVEFLAGTSDERHHRLREFALRLALPHAVGSDPDLLNMLTEEANWVRMERGDILWKEGALADHWSVRVSTTLMQWVSVHVVAQLEDARKVAYVFFKPHLAAISVTDVSGAVAMFETGYEPAQDILQALVSKNRDAR